MLEYCFRIIKFCIFCIIIFINSCINVNDNYINNNIFELKDFYPITNYFVDTINNITHDFEADKLIYIDYNNAIDGIIIPSSKQVDDKGFIFEFKIKNKSKQAQKFYYKIYYQNETYKFTEIDSAKQNKQHIYADENFYGSWEDTNVEFKTTFEIPADGRFYIVKDTFRIVGNPRNEKQYYENGVNNRWKRNPRVGKYRFMLVITTFDNIKNKIIPEYIRNISIKKNFKYINPFYYFLYGEGQQLPNTIVKLSSNYLKVIAKPDINNGIYINPANFNNEKYSQYFTNLCGQNENIYKNSPFQQFIHYVDISTKMYNIPVIADVLAGDYTLTDYNWNKRFIPKEELVGIVPTTAEYPCQNIFLDQKEGKIIIKNLASYYGKWQKQNVGIITRHGFTYGKYTVKCKLTELLNKYDLWNGITNAIWLLSQSDAEWNYRRDCRKEGYLATYWGGRDDKRVKNVGYSEIDFEILKTSPYCPSYSFPPAFSYGIPNKDNVNLWNIKLPEQIEQYKGYVTVACTNWDMACWEPKNFGVGCQPIIYQGKVFESHRWDHWYRALTQKSLELDDELFGRDYYYFQIEWKPEEIIWRIGPEKNQLRVVGYMNGTITSIPNNQMLLIITQEFHNTKWWPGTPYSQDNIPFPAKDITGEIYEITIE